MRSLFTQLSLLVGILTATNLGSAQASAGIVALWGIGAGLTTYALLLLGDYAVHRFLEDTTASVRLRDGAPYVEVHERDDVDDLTNSVAA